MKKLFFMLAALCVAAGCLGGCGEKKDEFSSLNEMFRADYSQIVLTVTDTFDEDTALKSEYVISRGDEGAVVDYAVERFAAFDLQGDLQTASPKTTLTGKATFKDGFLISMEGDEASLPRVIATGLTFKKEYFDNIELSSLYLRADVVDPSGFLSSEIACNGMKVAATFLETFYEISVTYTSENGNFVEFQFDFTL